MMAATGMMAMTLVVVMMMAAGTADIFQVLLFQIDGLRLLSVQSLCGFCGEDV